MIDFNKKFKNTAKFRQAAIFFEKNGYYADLEDDLYWVQEAYRCKEGYTVDGDFITGYHYFYLNYLPINRKYTYEKVNPRTGKRKLLIERRLGFLKFYDYDAYFFEYCEELMYEEKYGAVMKARLRGYSFKALSMLARNYTFIPASKGYAVAANEDFLIRDGLLTKCWDMLNHLQRFTPWGWLRGKVDQKMHKRASYMAKNPHTGKMEERGFMSEIIGISINKDPDKIRGIRGVGRDCIMVWEELGLNPWLGELWEAARPIMDTGFMLAIGTGSIDNQAVLGLKELFYKPSAYNVHAVKNIWDDHMDDTECLFFCPQYTNMDDVDEDGNLLYMDEDGNTLTEKAYQKLTDDLDKLIEANADSRRIDQYIIEHSRCPMESFLESGGNIFPKKRIMEQELKIRTNTLLYNFKQVGKLSESQDGEMIWTKKAYGDITEYPLNLSQKPEGAIVIWEHPKPLWMHFSYVIGVDPYDVDLANTSTSLGSCFVWKRFCPGDDFSDCIVLEYSGRPDKADDFYENVRMLAKYYNATVMSENMNRGIFTYFKIKGCEHLLARQPDGVLSDILKSSNVHRGYGVHMTTGIRDTLLGWLNDKLREEYSPGVDHISKVLSLPLLQELQSWNGKRNCDRVSLMLVLMIYLKQLERFKSKEINPDLEQNKSRWIQPFFKTNSYRY